MKVLTAEQMRELDRRTTQERGVPSLQLMERAGEHVADCVQRVAGRSQPGTLAVLCGKGNNGGDGLVAARILRGRGVSVRVFLFAAPSEMRGDAHVNLQRWQELGEPVHSITSESQLQDACPHIKQAGIIVDALLGTGARGRAEGLYASAIAFINSLRPGARVISVDIPSGLQADADAPSGPAVHADHTVTFTAPKVCLVAAPACALAGEVEVRDIGTPAALLEGIANCKVRFSDAAEFSAARLRRTDDAHKGSFGHVLLIAGSRGKTGAAILAAHAALRSGAGLVTAAVPEAVLPIVACGLPELMTEPLPATEEQTISTRSMDYGRFQSLLRGKSVLAIGPGLSLNPETRQFVTAAIRDADLPIILDADALNAFAGNTELLKSRKARHLVLTPHPGEMARLCGCDRDAVQASRIETARKAAAEWNAIVVLKGFRTVITAPDGDVFINSTGNPGMATGGSGDVLTGILAALVAQLGTDDLLRTISLGVYLHGRAGDLAARALGQIGMIAGDMIGFLPQAFQEFMGGSPHE